MSLSNFLIQNSAFLLYSCSHFEEIWIQILLETGQSNFRLWS